ncbi:MAG: endonuclease/exonuclease/phosphatase family protein [Ignavibacteriaceae bacterium]
MKKIIILIIFCILINHPVSLAGNSAADTLFVASWNLENLFDTVDDPGKTDEEFLPGSKKDWTNERLDKKLSNLARVIHAMNNNRGPDILGVCEVEHESLLKSMISKFLSGINYQVAYRESPDERGIDNGLLYNAGKLKLLSIFADTVHLNDTDKTRLILNANLLLKESGDTLHVFINHWPSRYGGAEKTEIKRDKAASALRKRVDFYLAQNKGSKIIIMGDFNDEPGNESVLKILDAQPYDCNAHGSLQYLRNDNILLNASYENFKNGEGTYKYRDDWNMLDQIIISSNLVLGKVKYICNSFKIFKPIFLVEQSGKYKGNPFPTYGGNRYLGGYSDHFPVTAEFSITGK